MTIDQHLSSVKETQDTTFYLGRNPVQLDTLLLI